MKKLALAALFMPLLTLGQKITKDIRPDTHELWLATNDVMVNLKIIQSDLVLVHFRTQGAAIFVYLSGPIQIGANDYVSFITDGDTVVGHSTGIQRGGSLNNTPYHEYTLTRQDLVTLSEHVLKQVVVSHYTGWNRLNIPEKDQHKLEPYCAAVLKNMQ